MLLALCCLCNSILSYFNLDVCVLSYIGGISVIPLIFLYLASYMFRFCEYHRMFLHYIVVTWVINIYDYYYILPLSNLSYLCLQMIIAGISLFIILCLYVKSAKKSTVKIVDNIDAGNSNITEKDSIEIIDALKRFTDKKQRLSKYSACQYLNVSRATFDNYVREGKLPRGKHEAGFKELSWDKKTLDEFINKIRRK